MNAPFKCKVLVVFLLVLASLLVQRHADAHEVGLSRGDYALSDTQVSAHLAFSRRELIGAVSGLDANRDGLLEAGEISQARDAIRSVIADKIEVEAASGPCALKQWEPSLTEEDGVALSLQFMCGPRAPLSAKVTLGFFEALPHGHRHIARTSAGESVLFKANPTLTLSNSVQSTGSGAAPASSHSTGLGGLFLMGVEHILIGFDHLAFLLGLLLIGGRLRSLLWVVTAFTLAHSITLGLATLGVVTLSPRIVEPLIALSIVYVGAENFFAKDASKRWRITFPFGLIHGFGFAGALAELKLPSSEIGPALLLFNLGVEAGQLAVIAIALPLLAKLHKQAWFEKKGQKALNVALIAAGLFWFVTRVMGIG